MKAGFLSSLLIATISFPFEAVMAQGETPKVAYENYSFDFSAHTRPIAYTTFGNTLELVNKVKLNPAVADRAGAYKFDTKLADKDFEIDLEFTVKSELDEARGFMVLLTQQEMLEEEFMNSSIGYRQNYEGIAVYIFRHPHQQNKWFVMTLQNQGSRSALRLENQMYSGLRNLNHCEIDMEEGVRTGLRIRVNDKQIVTQVKDSDDVSYRDCAKQGKVSKTWNSHHFAIAAKNSPDERGQMIMTDIDIDSIQISTFRPQEMYSADAYLDERNWLLLKRHAQNDGSGESFLDSSRLFELNLAHDLAKEQKKNLMFLDEYDEFDDVVFKHYYMLKRVDLNLQKFNSQLEEEIYTEEQFEHDLMSSAQLTETQVQLESLYKLAEMLKGNLESILQESRSTLDSIVAKENMQKRDDRRQQQNFDANQVSVDPQVMEKLDQAHQAIDKLIKNGQRTLERNQDFLAEFTKQYEQEKPLEKVQDDKGRSKVRLATEILAEIESSVRSLKTNILTKYTEETSVLTMIVLAGIFAGLAFTFLKVNKMVNKAHMF